MFVITISRWRKKLALLLIGAVFVIGLGLGINWILSPDESPTAVPIDNLKKDVLTQPVKVQAPPAETEKTPDVPSPPAKSK